MSNNAKILGVFFLILIVSFIAFYKLKMDKNLFNLQVIGQPGHVVGGFKFVNQDGDTITEKNVANKVLVVEYFFTTCKTICPKMNENMSKVYQEFRGNNKVAFLSHTVDPQTDTPAQLKRYAAKFEASSTQWHFLTGSKEDLYKKAIKDYLVTASETPEDDVSPTFIHTQNFVLVDKWGRVRGRYYDGTDVGEVNQLIGDIKNLIKEQETLEKENK